MKQVIIALIYCFSIGCEPTSNSLAVEEKILVEAGSFKSNLKLVDLQEKQINRSNDKILILNLWATWCRPCIREMPDLVEMQNQLSSDFELLLASDEESDQINRFLSMSDFDLTFIRINNSLESLGVYSLPTTFIIGKDGQLLETLVGARKWDSPKQIEQLKTYLK